MGSRFDITTVLWFSSLEICAKMGCDRDAKVAKLLRETSPFLSPSNSFLTFTATNMLAATLLAVISSLTLATAQSLASNAPVRLFIFHHSISRLLTR